MLIQIKMAYAKIALEDTFCSYVRRSAERVSGTAGIFPVVSTSN
jgi:hypothetical protein